VTSFYEDDEYGRICPGMKDFVGVWSSKGVREHKQKWLVLCNLSKLCEKFKKSHTGANIAFSKFCELHPEWCVLAGAPGTHSICVYCILQNVKMMISSAKLTHTYKDLLSVMVCGMDSEVCTLYGCPLWHVLTKLLSV
jgi:hypothetical protein